MTYQSCNAYDEL